MSVGAPAAAATPMTEDTDAGAKPRPAMSTIFMSPDFSRDRFRLLELPPELASHIEAGQRLQFKGNDVDPLVLVTGDKTYAVKMADTSNSLLLLPPAQAGSSALDFAGADRVVEGCLHSYLEVAPTLPRLERLTEILSKYTFDESSLGEGAPGFEGPEPLTTAKLEEMVQCSHAELQAALRKAHAFEFNGGWRILHRQYFYHALDQVLNAAAAEGLDLSRMSLKQCTKSLEGHHVPEFVVRVLLRQHGDEVTEDDDIQPDADEIFALDPLKICRSRAAELLEMSQEWVYQDFMDAWAQLVPDSMTISPDMLKGLALVEDETAGGPKAVVAFKAESLPTDPKPRFAALFAKRARWTVADISPYLEDIVQPPMTIDKLLFKYAKSFNKDGIRVYQKRL